MTPRRYSVLLSARAAADIDATVTYIAGDSPSNAHRWYEGCLKAIAGLELLPRMWPHAVERPLAEWGVRSRSYKGHRVLFIVREHEVVVVCVRHGAMRPLTLAAFVRLLQSRARDQHGPGEK